MPVEIRELIIQAQIDDDREQPTVQTKSTSPSSTGSDEPENDGDGIDPELLDRVTEICMARIKEWLTEKNMR